MINAFHAAQAADVSEQAASVAKRAAAHAEDVAQNTAAALRYTQDVLRKANAASKDVDELGRQAKELEAEAGIGSSSGVDVKNTIEPYPNEAEPFGQEESGKELTKSSIKESDQMIDQIEDAQGVESKRAVYRALTKLRGATVASYDGIAKGHLKNVDKFSTQHKWREDHKVKHLAEEEGDTQTWAFKDSMKGL